ncbi:hypothetical protein SCP_0504040 [Sparassis crispa]|uniref:Uncharacterized protein n=1 Tax=Sparassis crispa TaxID=139825 RepID=A0A401GMC6_9APHY|nr:hypothetical protein SCP_0504040 [Sparassis crispa]GBE83356.1 hypothetical protein SCP_0504040 [Sparassis crispa]
MSARLSPTARRLRTIIVTVPIIGATSLVLYNRLVLGQPRRTFPRGDPTQSDKKILEIKGEPQGSTWRAERKTEEAIWGESGHVPDSTTRS